MVLEIHPDTLYLESKARNWDRLEPRTVSLLGKLHGKTLGFSAKSSYKDLAPGTIVYGGFTAGGHCLVVADYHQNTFSFFDPLGVYTNSSYDFNRSGEGVVYEKELLIKLCGIDGQLWTHK
jgi:hypothetical protein